MPMGFSRQEYWRGLPCPSPGDPPDPGIVPTSLMSPALACGLFTTRATGGRAHSLSRVWLFATPWTVARQAPLSVGFSRREYWSGLPFTSPGDLPDPGVEPGSSVLQADSLPLSHWGSPDSCWGNFQATFTVPRSEDYLVLPQCRRKVVPITITRTFGITRCDVKLWSWSLTPSLKKKNRNVNISMSCPQALSLLKQLKTLH